jgi:Protein of unknown function (DUF1569)
MPTLFENECRTELLARLERLDPEHPPQWGRLSAPQMVTHLGDQMRLTLGDVPWSPVRKRCPWRYPGIKQATLYVLPWPKGGIQGPEEAFVTQPGDWSMDVAALEELVARFVARSPSGTWPAHPFFGPLSGRQWGVFCFRHFDHHLSQFGV